MSLFSSILGGRAESKATDFEALTMRALLGMGGTSKSGVMVGTDTALRVPAALACGRVLAEGIAQVPLKLYREHEDGTKEIARKHPLHRILFRRPNDWMTSFEFRETMMFHAVFARGGYAYKNVVNGRVAELLPLLPGSVTVRRDKWNTRYEVRDSSGIVGTFPREQIFHLRGPSWNGIEGLDIVEQAREAIGLALATEESQARLHANGSRAAGYLTTDGKLTKEQYDRIKAQTIDANQGVSAAFRTWLLDGGLKFQQATMTGVDAQTLESRRFQIEEIARAFRVFPQMIGSSDKTATYASAEQFFLAHVVHSLAPWAERWEQAIDRDLLAEEDHDRGYFAKFSMQGLMRGDAKSRAEYFASGIVNGWLTRNEARRIEDLDPLDGLDEPLVPLNMAPGSQPPGDQQDPAVDQKHLARAIAEQLGAVHLEAKIGRILSARNEGRLKQARDLLDEVLQQVSAEEQESTP